MYCTEENLAPRLRRRGFVLLMVGLLIWCLRAPAAFAQENTILVSSAADITTALGAAVDGDQLTFLFQQDVSLDSSLDDRAHIVIPQGVTAVFQNAPGKAVTVTRLFDKSISSLPYSPMVTVDGTLIIEEDAAGGSLSFTGGDQYFANKSMFQVAGTISMRSGTIADARGYSGGAIYATAQSTVNVSGGTFTNCVAQDNGFGGAICAYGDLNIAGGVFSGNDAGMGSAVYYYGGANTLLTMIGGTMADNGKSSFLGGAIAIIAGNARITGGTFTDNTASAWGGAIYVDVDANVFMACVLVSENHSTLQGGGIFNCATGGGNYRRFCGMTLYSNTSSGDPNGNSSGDDFFSYKKNNTPQLVYVSDYTLNGAQRPWYQDDNGSRYQAGDAPADAAYYQDTAERFALKSGATSADYDASRAFAWVLLSGNSSASGGAIANNGVLNIGYNTALILQKVIRGTADSTLFPFDITVTDANGNPYTGKLFYELNGAEHPLAFDANGKATLQMRGGEQATLYDIPLGFFYHVVEAETEGFSLVDSSGTDGVMSGEQAIAIFTNEKAQTGVPENTPAPTTAPIVTTNFSVTKRWEGADMGAIELTLYANGVKLSPQPAYTRDGNKYTYSALPKYDSANREIVYSAKERYFDGYMTIYANAAPWEDETRYVYSGGTVINRALTSISVRKVWTGLDGEAPAITLTLYRNGEIYNCQQPEPDANGIYTYVNLPFAVNGVVTEYYIVETPMNGYSTSYVNTASYADVSDRAYNGGVITNRKVLKTGDDELLPVYWAMMVVSSAILALLGRGAIRKRRRD